jgi:3-hydroxyisobutyrate dehydrogenase
MARVAFIGIGTMGLPMARCVIAAGHDVVACDIDTTRAAKLGVDTVSTAAEAARRCDVVITSLPSVAAVEDAILGENGVAAGARSGSSVIDMSTSPPALARRVAESLAEGDVTFLDAPVSGGPTGAEAGTLAIMVGGERNVFDRWAGLLGAMGARVEYVGGHGAGQTVKLCNNLMVACTMAGMAQVSAVLEREGVDPEQAYEVFTHSTSDSSVMRRRFPLAGVRPEHPASKNFEPMFRLDLLVKDVTLAQELLSSHGLESSMGVTAAALYEKALEQGLGALDYSAVYRAVEPDTDVVESDA